MLVPFNFAPKGWAFCQGQLLPLSQNTALFSLLGTTYGGDGESTFGLPNLQGSIPVHYGQGNGLSEYDLGEIGGETSVTLLSSEMPQHSHTTPSAMANTARGTLAAPATNATIGTTGRGVQPVYVATGTSVQMSYEGLSIAGSVFPHNNLMPYLTLNYIICLSGFFPPRP
jgi:microcystin-dependent protein